MRHLPLSGGDMRKTRTTLAHPEWSDITEAPLHALKRPDLANFAENDTVRLKDVV